MFLFTTQFTLPMVVTTAAYSLIISKLATRGGVTRSQGAGAGRNTVQAISTISTISIISTLSTLSTGAAASRASPGPAAQQAAAGGAGGVRGVLAAAQPHQHCRGLLIQRPLLEVVLSIKYYLVPQSCCDSWYNVCFSCCHCFAMASTCCNPLLYCWLNQNFRCWYQPPHN